jgi:flavin-dependent dehydrogenase
MREVRARLVIGADGLHSVTARLLGRRRYGAPRRFGFVGHVAGVTGLGTRAELHVGADGYVGLNYVGGNQTNVAVVVPAHRAARARGDATGFWHSALEGMPGVRGRVRLDALHRPVLATGPFAAWSSRVVTDGALLVGDAADFFDPFTGEGICSALAGAELAADTAIEALQQPGGARAVALQSYAAARRRRFAGKWAVERLIGYGMLAPRLFDRAVGRLEERGLSHTLIGVTGHVLPAREVLRPGFLAALMV